MIVPFYGPCLFKYFNGVYLNKLTDVLLLIVYNVLSAPCFFFFFSINIIQSFTRFTASSINSYVKAVYPLHDITELRRVYDVPCSVLNVFGIKPRFMYISNDSTGLFKYRNKIVLEQIGRLRFGGRFSCVIITFGRSTRLDTTCTRR